MRDDRLVCCHVCCGRGCASRIVLDKRCPTEENGIPENVHISEAQGWVYGGEETGTTVRSPTVGRSGLFEVILCSVSSGFYHLFYRFSFRVDRPHAQQQ